MHMNTLRSTVSWRFTLMQVRYLAEEFQSISVDCHFGISLLRKWLNKIYSHRHSAFIRSYGDFGNVSSMWLDLFCSILWIENPISHIHSYSLCIYLLVCLHSFYEWARSSHINEFSILVRFWIVGELTCVLRLFLHLKRCVIFCNLFELKEPMEIGPKCSLVSGR